MIPHDEYMLDLVAAHALGAIDATSEECAAVREHLRTCEICREEYYIASAAAAAVGMSAAEQPPAQLRERILRALPSRKASTVVPLRRSRSWFVGAAAAAAVLLAAGAWWVAQHRAPSWAAACVPAALNCHASGVLTLPSAGRMHLDVNGLAQLPPGKAYQAWVIVPGSAPQPEPLISTTPQGHGNVDISFSPPKGTIVAVTVEPAGGSLTPTSKPFLTATVE